MGHERCGAVQATIEGGEPKTHIQGLVEAIAPAVASVVKQLNGSKPILSEQAGKGKIKIVGAVYELASGKVTLLSDYRVERSCYRKRSSSAICCNTCLAAGPSRGYFFSCWLSRVQRIPKTDRTSSSCRPMTLATVTKQEQFEKGGVNRWGGAGHMNESSIGTSCSSLKPD